MPIFFLFIRRMIPFCGPMMPCPTPVARAAPTHTQPSLSSTATHHQVQAQGIVQTPRKKTQTYLDPLLRAITAAARMAPLFARPHPYREQRSRMPLLPSLPESATVLLSRPTSLFSLLELHMQSLR